VAAWLSCEAADATMSYDRADYDPPRFAVRIAFFIAWAMLNGLEGPLHQEDDQELLGQLRRREITPRKFLEIACDDKLWEADLSDEGNAFARVYYLGRPGVAYFDDYEQVLVAASTDLRAVADSWENYDKIAPLITRRYEAWKNG